MAPEFFWLAVAAVVITSSARLTRLATYDKFPPVAWLRDKYAAFMDARERTRGWVLLAYCGYCASFWLTALVVLWAALAGVFEGPQAADETTQSIWWVLNGALGASYAAAILMARDGDIGEQE